MRDFYETLVERTVPVSSTRVAELTKLLENTFRHVNVALVNEFAMYANDPGIDVWETIDARESPAAVVAERLVGLGADVRVCDPHVREHWIATVARRVEWSVDEIGAAAVVVVLTDHDSFDYDAVAQHAAYAFDTRSRVRDPNVKSL